MYVPLKVFFTKKKVKLFIDIVQRFNILTPREREREREKEREREFTRITYFTPDSEYQHHTFGNIAERGFVQILNIAALSYTAI